MIGKFYSFCEVSISIASSCSGTLAKLCSIAMKLLVDEEKLSIFGS